jgi:hypothetical protein
VTEHKSKEVLTMSEQLPDEYDWARIYGEVRQPRLTPETPLPMGIDHAADPVEVVEVSSPRPADATDATQAFVTEQMGRSRAAALRRQVRRPASPARPSTGLTSSLLP